MKRKIGWITLLLLVGLPILFAIWTSWESHLLNRRLAYLQSIGEPITPAALHLDSVPDANNASLIYKSATKLVAGDSKDWKRWSECDRGEFMNSLTADERTTVHTIVAQNGPALAMIDTARGMPANGWNDDFSHPQFQSIEKFDLGGARSLANLLKLAAFDAHAEGNDALAVERLNDAMDLAESAERRPGLISHLVAIGMSSLAADSSSQLAPELHIGDGGAARGRVAAIVKQLQDERDIDAGIMLCWRSERMISLDMLQSFVPAQSGGYVIKPFILDDARLLVDHMRGIMTASSAPSWPAAQLRMPTTLPSAIVAHPIPHLGVSLLLPGLSRAAQADYHSRADRRLALVALTIRLYSIDHDGHLPGTLSDLVSTYLPCVPIDPLSGGPLLYKLNPPRIYSVGDDGADDGGIPTVPIPRDPNHRLRGDIVVYLQAQPRAVKQ